MEKIKWLAFGLPDSDVICFGWVCPNCNKEWSFEMPDHNDQLECESCEMVFDGERKQYEKLRELHGEKD